MFNLIKNEIIKIFFNKKIYAAMIVLFLIQLLPLFLAFFSPYKATHVGQTYPLLFFGFVTALIMPIFIAILVADVITEEYITGTLSLTLINPVTRSKLLLAKVVSTYLIILFLLFYTLVLSYILGTIFFGWGTEFIDRGIVYSTIDGFLLTIKSYLLASIPLLAFAMLVILIGFLFHNSGVVVGIALSIIIGFFLVGALLPDLQPYLITSYFNNFSTLILLFPTKQDILLAIKTLSSYMVISYITSYIIFKRRDILH